VTTGAMPVKLSPLESALKATIARDPLQLWSHQLPNQGFTESVGSTLGIGGPSGGERVFTQCEEALQTLK
jgi:hypothetical protein